MGDLKGHAIPGSFFLLYGLWWAVNCLRRHLICHRRGRQYEATATYAMDCIQGRVSRLPVEGFVKVLLSLAGMLGELLAHLPVPPIGIVQHATMYFFFFLSGMVDIAMHYGIPLPARTDYVSFVVALVVEGLLFASHIHGRSLLDIHIHMLLVYVIFITAVVTALEAKFQRSAVLSLARAYLVMLQGSWFWAVGIILYGHGEKSDALNVDSPESVMQATVYFSWHCAAHLVLLLFIDLVMIYCLRRSGQNFDIHSSKAITHLRPAHNKVEHSEIQSGDDTEDS